MKDWKKEIFTIPNLLSLFRLILIPVYMVIFLNAETAWDYALSAGILALSCLTDLVDGKIARHFNMISTVGKVLDPIADKATQFTLMVCMAKDSPVLWSLLALFVIKESFQLIAGLVNYRKGKMLKGALMTGKVCTTVLFVSLILMVLLNNHLTSTVALVICVVDAGFMLVAFAHYAFTYYKKTPMIQDIEKDNQ